MCERAFNCPLRTFGLRVRLTFSHNGKLIGQIGKIGIAKHRLAEKADRASYTLLGIKLSSSFFFFLLPSCPSRLRGSIILILFWRKYTKSAIGSIT
jgi:hypothetical protein